VDKADLMLHSWWSLLNSINHCDSKSNIRVTVLDDHSNVEVLGRMQAIANSFPLLPVTLIELETPGNGYSMLKNFEYGRDHCDGLVYFVEDDYLCHQNMVQESLAFYRAGKSILQKEIAINPTDDPMRYRECYPSYIFLGERNHWRQVGQTTCTFMVHHGILNRYWNLYERMSRYGEDPSIGEDTTINLVYKDVPCFSPIPTLALHYQYEHTLSPFEDHEEWWEKSYPSVKRTLNERNH